MDDLGWNKIFGAILATALVILGLKQAAEMIYAPQIAAKPGYAIAVAEEAGGGAAVVDTPPDWGTVLPTADVAAGLQVSTKCASCHTFTPGGPNGTGPNNYGVVGRKPGSAPGFAYSSSMTEFGGKHAAWTYDELYNFLANPTSYVAGTRMSFVGLKKPEDRVNLIAWLRQQSASPVAIPAPNPKAAAAVTADAGKAAEAGKPAPADATKVADTAKGATPAGKPTSGAGGNATGDAGQTGKGAAAVPAAQATSPGAPPK